MRDGVSGAGLVLLSVFYFLAARGLPSGRGEPGPVFFPTLLSGVLLVLGLVILVRGWRSSGGEARPRSLLVIGITVLYVVVFSSIGFAIATILYSGAVALVLGRRGWGVLVFSAAATASIYFLFGLGLGVPLP
ncbi:MAG: hypothetical protein E2P02_27120 [Acidobacteria bacterium]|nr:MAG: hypothetical protein E2P02_27120 [Acidobacteriota bacterium]